MSKIKTRLSIPSLIILVVVLICLTACGDQPSPLPSVVPTQGSSPTPAHSTTPAYSPTPTPEPVPALDLEDYNGGFFSIRKPAGWDVITAGSCSSFAFCLRDRKHPANQIFYFGEVGPVYLAEEQKTVDSNYMAMGGYPITWFEMPVVNPLTPENLLLNFDLIAQTSIARSFMPGLPELKDMQIISAAEEVSFLSGVTCPPKRSPVSC